MENPKKLKYEKPAMVTVVCDFRDVLTTSAGFRGDWDGLGSKSSAAGDEMV